jgi:hypothetical protein
MLIVKNFNREDCVHFEWKEIDFCCGRKNTSGVCKLTNKDGMCNTKLDYCQFQSKEEQNVHSQKLPNLDSRNCHRE